ncbi:hypothetical protein OB996_20430 [Bacillus cereus]|nr:hypothetical protein [Bacillus cereus]MCU5036460.1 hypothetical protein [Bacillus cereus]
MSFFTEFIIFLKSSFVTVSAISGFLLGVIAVSISYIEAKNKKIEVEEELRSYIEEIMQQRNVKKKESNVIKFFNSHILSVTMVILYSKQSNSRKKQKKEKGDKNSLIISALFLESKLKKIYKAYIIIGLGSIILLGMSSYFFVPPYINLIPLIFAILTCSYQLLLKYRIKNGLFGTNDYEAKELIEFIVHNNDKINGNKIFNEEVISNTIINFSNYVKKVHFLNEH